MFSIPTGVPLSRLPRLGSGPDQLAVVRAGKLTYHSSSLQLLILLQSLESLLCAW